MLNDSDFDWLPPLLREPAVLHEFYESVSVDDLLRQLHYGEECLRELVRDGWRGAAVNKRLYLIELRLYVIARLQGVL